MTYYSSASLSDDSVLYKAEKTHRKPVLLPFFLSSNKGCVNGNNVIAGTHLLNYCYKPSEHTFDHI